jgi:hypothetical protein
MWEQQLEVELEDTMVIVHGKHARCPANRLTGRNFVPPRKVAGVVGEHGEEVGN